jgi:hypothetical protein
MDNDTNTILGASYHFYEGGLTKFSSITNLPGEVSKESKYITFYTFDGNPIITIEHNFDFALMNAKLDSSALPPKPVSYKKFWWPTFKAKDTLILESVIAQSGYVVLFHDKNGNRIGWEVLNSADEDISGWKEYDLSEAVEEESDFSLNDDLWQEVKDTHYGLKDTQINFSLRESKIEIPEEEGSRCIMF